MSRPDELTSIERMRESAMPLQEITLTLFAACNSIRVVAYVPQILKAATEKNGASSISFTTWGLFLVAHVSTVTYALANRSDDGLAACFAIKAVCCGATLGVAYWNRRRHAKGAHMPNRTLYVAA